MNRLTALGLASLVAYGLLIGSKYAGFSPAVREDRAAAAPVLADNRGDAGVAPVNPEPNASVAFPAPAPATTYRPSPAAVEFRTVKDLRAYADGLAARKGALSGDERYHLARALEECQFATTINEDLAAYSAKQKRQFLASLPAGDPMNAKRVAAYEAIDTTQRCLRFQNAKISPREIEDLYVAAAQQGDARAQARLLVAELTKNSQQRTPDATAQRGNSPGDDLSRMISLLETHDPEALLIVGGFLSQQVTASQLRIGTQGEVPEPSAFLGAFSLVACDFGPDCVALNREPLNACAYAGYCSAQTYEELYQNFLASPWVYAQAMRYREIILRAIATRNWALLGLVPPSARQDGNPQ
jgi:hypothetical protein